METKITWTLLYNLGKGRARIFFNNKEDGVKLYDKMSKADNLLGYWDEKDSYFIPTLRVFDKSDEPFV